MHILVLSVGSLLGQNILDLLIGREDIRVTGLNTFCDNPRVFRCDKLYKCPPVQSDRFKGFFLGVLDAERPDLILPGRDEDMLFLASLIEAYPRLKSIVPTGPYEVAVMMYDKAKSYMFAKTRDLPFAETFIPDQHGFDEAMRWVEKIGFPVFAKPRTGFGSNGIKLVMNKEQFVKLIKRNKYDYVIQEVLDYSEDKKQFVERMQIDLETGIPLSSHMPDSRQFAGQTCIHQDGTLSEIFTSVSLMVIGRCERAERFEDPELEEVVRNYALAVSKEGWRGMFNLQCKKTSRGYVAHEMNGRMSGSTSARRLMGFDELAILANSFLNKSIKDELNANKTSGYVYRSLTDYFIPYDAILDFETKGWWEKQ